MKRLFAIAAASLFLVGYHLAWADDETEPPAEPAGATQAVEAAPDDTAESPAEEPTDSKVDESLDESDGSVGEADKKSVEETISRNVDNLGSGFKDVAEAAEKNLIEIGSAAEEALRKAAKSSHADVARRAKRVLKRINAFTHVVVDALGDPIAGGKLEFSAAGQKIEVVPDAKGHITVLKPPGAASKILGRFCHPDYGCAVTQIRIPDEKKRVVVPLVKAGTVPAGRALRGVVVGPDNQPLADVEIRVATQAGGPPKEDQPVGWPITDREGRFSYYPPQDPGARGADGLLAANSVFRLAIDPADHSLFPYLGVQSNSAPAQIQLERPEHFHKFKFEERGGGLLTDRDELAGLRLFYLRGPGSGPIPLKQDYVSQGGKLPPGTYLVGGRRTNVYRPLEVKNDSPETLTFRLPAAITLSGKVINGISGKPAAGAFVIGYTSIARYNLAELSDGDWKALHELPSNAGLENPALARLALIYGIKGFTRTDAEGHYEIVSRADDAIYAVLAFDENYLPMEHRRPELELDAQLRATVPDLALFPAAKVKVKLTSKRDRGVIVPVWHMESEDQPPWFAQFQKVQQGAERQFECSHYLFVGETRQFQIPAELSLTLELRAPYNQELAPARLPETLQLAQGETRDVGEVEIPVALRLTVQVVDNQGAAAKGIDVRRVYKDGTWDLPHRTDEKGESHFYVDPNSAGHFWVDVPTASGLSDAPNLSATFEVSGDAPADPFKISLSEEQLKAAREKK